MNDELQSKLAEVLGGIADGVTQAKDFAVEQLPDVAQQYIMFGLVWETAVFGVLLASTIGGCYGLIKLFKHSDSVDGFLVVIVLVLGICTVAQLKYFFLVWFAPKLYLLQGIAGLLK